MVRVPNPSTKKPVIHSSSLPEPSTPATRTEAPPCQSASQPAGQAVIWREHGQLEWSYRGLVLLTAAFKICLAWSAWCGIMLSLAISCTPTINSLASCHFPA